MSTVCILYGFGERKHVSKRFQRALKQRGHGLVDNPSDAQVIITHSGGCLLLPDKISAKQIIHIAPYYWPDKTWVSCMSRKLIDDLRTHHKGGELRFWARKTFWNVLYSWNMSKNFRMLGNIRNKARWQRGDITIVARPKFDTFCTPDPKAMPFEHAPAFVSMPGHHDDCWRDPKPYLLLVKNW